MAGIRFVNAHDISSVIIESGQPFLFVLRAPVRFNGRDIVIGFRSASLERSGSVHRSEAGRAKILRSLLNLSSYLRGQGDELPVHYEIPDGFQILCGVRDESLLSRMVLLNRSKYFDRFVFGIDKPRGIREDLLFSFQFLESDLEQLLGG